MKNIISTLTILIFLLAACDRSDSKEILPLSNLECVEMSQNPSWAIEDFKNEYTIQFPENYEGTGMEGFEGNFFQKKRADKKIFFTYSFCSELYCEDFGDALAVPAPNSISAQDENGNEVVLDSKTIFCVNGEIEGVLYYNTNKDAIGKYFMKQGSEFLEGLTIEFANTEYHEVENIIKTISEI